MAQLSTVQQVAGQLGVSRLTLYKMLEDQAFPAAPIRASDELVQDQPLLGRRALPIRYRESLPHNPPATEGGTSRELCLGAGADRHRQRVDGVRAASGTRSASSKENPECRSTCGCSPGRRSRQRPRLSGAHDPVRDRGPASDGASDPGAALRVPLGSRRAHPRAALAVPSPTAGAGRLDAAGDLRLRRTRCR